MQYVLIIGAKSDIAQELARIYAENGFNLYLAGRNLDEIQDLKKDIELRYSVDVQFKEFDIANFEPHQEFYNSLNPKPVGVIVVAGYMNEQKICEKDFSETLKTINVNYTGAVSILNIVATYFEESREKNNFIIGVSSVAGDRGRKANYIYGSAKAGFTAYLSGLRNRLFESKVTVLTVKPGFVNTKMTENLNLPEKLTAQPDEVAKDIFNAQQKGKNVIYTKRKWALIMLIIKHIPEFIFKRLSI